MTADTPNAPVNAPPAKPDLGPLAHAAVTVAGLGHLRPAPGTWGSLPPVALAGLLCVAGAGPTSVPALYYPVLGAVLIGFTAACVAFGRAAEARFGGKDPGQVVADESAGQCIPLLALWPTATATPVPLAASLAVSFFAFRAFDIAKPPPCGLLQDNPGGWGIVLDDLAAGVYAALPTALVGWLMSG